jgi:hypothetical protein
LIDVSCGEVGELLIGGDCLAKDSIKNQTNTNEVFFHFQQFLDGYSMVRLNYPCSKLANWCVPGPMEFRVHRADRFPGENQWRAYRVRGSQYSATGAPAVDDALVTSFAASLLRSCGGEGGSVSKPTFIPAIELGVQEPFGFLGPAGVAADG